MQAEAYDQGLRSFGLAACRAKRLNFPTVEELESLSAPRKRSDQRVQNLLRYGLSYAKEASAKTLIQDRLHGTGLELLWLGEGTWADGIIRLRQALPDDSWMGVQVKSTNNPQEAVVFNGTRGYKGLVLLCLSLADNSLYVIPGCCVSVQCIHISRGGKWDAFRCHWHDLPNVLRSMLVDESTFPRFPQKSWRQPRALSQQVELIAHDLGSHIFEQAGLSVEVPRIEHGPFDMLVNSVIRVQSKARSSAYMPTCRYDMSLHRRDGPGATRQYRLDEFDALVVFILDKVQLSGFFVIPVLELHSQGLVGYNLRSGGFCIYPPWSTPAQHRSRAAKAWQAPYFFATDRPLSDLDFERLRGLVGACRRTGGDEHQT
eukprot:CAMPEP_0203886436 /NCGR_PEP_ID=MMETSP0359-20131031/30255_1 /ASSEMBLY_ACC=CAM_ASM_000338 /TAXON_ID=268821 /ORGANISM="Scrippsiella Hangoei, Strain SHTV-5" /LENGTH=372 /DNA_ID=CAMNT_0050807261 /DNA_START=310 /DNA_END=1428 /DNA_ORIENTATION=-